MLEERVDRIRLAEEDRDHRRAQEPYAAISRGISHGGGQTRPGNLCNNDANTQVTDELLAHDYFRRMAMFANREFQPSIIYTTL